ncbi:MAG: hypothetical protein E7333_02725 [Clostridiales bacterium]|nr:hypothetical protein [Clostridiales bacterium]
MATTKVIFASDIHACHIDWMDCPTDERMQAMIRCLNAHEADQVILLGDYALDFWGCDRGGCWLNDGVSNTRRLAQEILPALRHPWYMGPGNHEQYDHQTFREFTGCERQAHWVIGGYLIIFCDNFCGCLAPTQHSDGEYSATDLDRIRRLMALHPGLPVILCGHYFDETLEPAEFFDLLREEKRITALFCGHDHQFAVTPMGDSGVRMCHDGHFSYPHHATLDHPTPWGFLEAELTGAGVHVRYYSDEGAVTNEAHFPLRA